MAARGRVLAGGPVPVDAVDARVRQPLPWRAPAPRARSRAHCGAPPAQPAHQLPSEARRQRRVLGDDHVDQRVQRARRGSAAARRARSRAA